MKTKLIFAIAVVVVLVGIRFWYVARTEEKYKDGLETAINVMGSLNKSCASITNKYYTAWHDAIYKEGAFSYGNEYYGVDFNQAIRNANDIHMKPLVKILNNTFSGLQNIIKEMPTPMEKFKSADDKMHNCFRHVAQFVELANKPTGSLIGYSNKINTLHSNIASELTELKLFN